MSYFIKALLYINIVDYCIAVIEKLSPDCIILYGSLAKNTYSNRSDVDIIVISNNFQESFLDRIGLLLDLDKTRAPIEPLGYTTKEFENMLDSFRVTALDAIYDGIPLWGEEYFNSLKKQLDLFLSKGLHRTKYAWDYRKLMEYRHKVEAEFAESGFVVASNASAYR